MTTAGELLRRGHAVLDARGKEYDKAGGERSAAAVASMWAAATGKPMTEYEAWLFLILLKTVRLTSAPGPHDDSAMDGAVYFGLAGESKHRRPARAAEDGPGPDKPTQAGEKAAPKPSQEFVEFRVPIITPDASGEWYRQMDRAAERQTTVCTTPDVVHRWFESRAAMSSAVRRNGLVPKFHQVRANGWTAGRTPSGRRLYVLSFTLADLDLTASHRPFDDGTILQPQTGELFPKPAGGLTAEEAAPADPNQYAGCGVADTGPATAATAGGLPGFVWVTIGDDRVRPCHSFSFTSHAEIDRQRFLAGDVKFDIRLDADKLAKDTRDVLKPVVDSWVANVMNDVFGPAVSGYPTVPTWAQSMADAGPAAAQGVLIGPWGEVTAKGWGRPWLFTGRDGLPWMQPDDGGKPLPIHEDATVRQVAGYTQPVGWAIFANNVSGRREWGRITPADDLAVRRRCVFNPKIQKAKDPPVVVIVIDPPTTGDQTAWLDQIDRNVKAGRKVACPQWAMRRWKDARAGCYTTVGIYRDAGPDLIEGYPAWRVTLGDPITKPAAGQPVRGSRLPEAQRVAMTLTNAPTVVMDPTGPFPPEHWLDVVDQYAQATGGTVFMPEVCMLRWYHERGQARRLCAVRTGDAVAGLPGWQFRKMDLGADSGSQPAGRPANIDDTQTVPQVSNGRVLGDLERVLMEMEGMSPSGLARAGRKLQDVLAKMPQWAVAAQRRMDVPGPGGSESHAPVTNEQTRRPEETKAAHGGTGVAGP